MSYKRIKLKEIENWPPPFSAEIYKEFTFQFNKLNAHFQVLKNTFQQVRDALSNIGPLVSKYPEEFEKLSELGWFIGFDFDLWKPQELVRLTQTGKEDEVNSYMESEIENNIMEIEKILCVRFPSRKEPIAAGFRAHKIGEYYLSVPVFLSQSEGMAIELTNYSPFKKKNKKPEINQYLENDALKDLDYLLLSPLKKESLINTSRTLYF